MSEINSIANGTFTIGQTSATNFVAGPGIRIDEPSAGTVRIGNDETVLWSGVAATGTLTASESVLNFDHYKIYISERERGTPAVLEFHTENTATSGNNAQTSNGGYKAIALTMFQTTNKDFFTINSNHAVWNDSFTELSLSTTGYNKYMPWNSTGFTQWDNAAWTPTIRIHKIVGINRLSGSNA